MSLDKNFNSVILASEYIESHLTDEMSVATVCDQFSFSSWQFQRIFRALTGDSVGNYLRGRRLTLAAEMIVKKREIGFLDVAIATQFGSQEAFTRAFKNYFGVTPGNLRRQPGILNSKRKPVIDAALLQHIKHGIQRVPEILSFGPAVLAGISEPAVSHLHPETKLERTAPLLFQAFEPRRVMIEGQKSIARFGVFACNEPENPEASFHYFAGVEMNAEASFPHDLERLVLPHQTYAVFQNIGLSNESRRTIDYVYGIWLPESDFKRDVGIDFEQFPYSTYSLNDANSIGTFWLPIRPK